MRTERRIVEQYKEGHADASFDLARNHRPFPADYDLLPNGQ